MQIITRDDIDFPTLWDVLQQAQKVGLYSRDGKTHQVLASSNFVFVTLIGQPDKIAIKPSRNINEAMEMAKQLLKKEESRGSQIEIAETS
jgi:hypothetical protein